MLYRYYLHTFLMVYRTGSQTKAAEELHLTQPAVSLHIKSLENRLHRRLFVREGKKLIPTPAAHQLALQLGPHLDALDTLWESLSPSASKTVYLGGIAEFFAKVLVTELLTLTKQGIIIRFEMGHDDLLKKLLSDELDIAQFVVPVVHPGIAVEPFFDEDLVLVGHPQWRDKISPKDLKKGKITALNQLSWIAYDESLLFIKGYYQTIFQSGFEGKVCLMVNDLWSIETAAVAGIGVTVLPRYFCQKNLDAGKLILLYSPPKPFIHHFYLGFKDGALRNPYISLVRDTLKKAAKKYSYQF